MKFIIVVLLGLGIGVGASPADDIEGWWRTEIMRGEQKADFFLRFGVDAEGAPSAYMSLPILRMRDVPIGTFSATDSTLGLPGLSWDLSITEGGATLKGLLPPSLGGDQKTVAQFERSDEPVSPPSFTGASHPPAPIWTTDVGAEVWAGLVYDRRQDLVYLGTDDGRVWALRGRTGEAAWSRDLSAPIRATPTLQDGWLYVATDEALHALDALTGKPSWSTAFGEPLQPRLPTTEPGARWDHYSASAALDGDLVVVGARDGCIHALDRSSGAQLWKVCTDDIVTSTPAIGEGAVFFGGFDGSAYALSREDGTEIWRHDAGAAIPRDAILAGKGLVLFGSRSSYLLALETATGKPVWEHYFWSSWIDSPPHLRDGVVYVGSSDLLAVLALDSATGRELWSAPTPGWGWPGLAVVDDCVYAGVVGLDGYGAPREPGLLSLERQTGALRWILRPDHSGDGRMSGFASAPVADQARVFAADLDGNVYAFDDH